MTNVTKSIITRIKAKKRGWVFTPKDFLDIGSRAAVDKVLSRAVKSGMIRKVSRGIYDYPKTNPHIGIISSNIDDLAKVLAAKTGDKVFCSGAMAVNFLGLSTQMPLKHSYLTTGPSCIKKIGQQSIVFKHTRVPVFDNLPWAANLALQSMAYLGKNAIDDDMISKYSHKLSGPDKVTLSKAIPYLPAWMIDSIRKIQSGIYG